MFGKYIRNIHTKDGVYPINRHDLGKEKRIGDGKVDFKALFIKLKELGYDSYAYIICEKYNGILTAKSNKNSAPGNTAIIFVVLVLHLFATFSKNGHTTYSKNKADNPKTNTDLKHTYPFILPQLQISVL